MENISVSFQKRGQKKIEELKQEGKQLSQEILENQKQGDFQKNVALQSRKTEAVREENFLNHLRLCKESASHNFFSSMNRVFQGQKREIFEYYKNQKMQPEEQQDVSQSVAAEDVQEEEEEK